MTYETMISALRKIAASGEVHCEQEVRESILGPYQQRVLWTEARLKSHGGQYTAATLVQVPISKRTLIIPSLGELRVDDDEQFSEVSAIFGDLLKAQKDRHRAAEERWVQQLLAKP